MCMQGRKSEIVEGGALHEVDVGVENLAIFGVYIS